MDGPCWCCFLLPCVHVQVVASAVAFQIEKKSKIQSQLHRENTYSHKISNEMSDQPKLISDSSDDNVQKNEELADAQSSSSSSSSGGDAELSEEEDRDYVEDAAGSGSAVVSTTASSLGAAPPSPSAVRARSSHADDGAVNESDNLLMTMGQAQSMLLEGDYFPDLPADVLAELRALDETADDDDDIMIRGGDGKASADSAAAAAGGPDDSSPMFVPIVLSTSGEAHSVNTPHEGSCASAGGDGGAPRGKSPSVTSSVKPAMESSRSPTTAGSVRGGAPLKHKRRVRWADDHKGKCLVHHAKSFTIPNPLPSHSHHHRSAPASAYDEGSSSDGPAPSSALAAVFRSVTNDDRSSYLVSKTQRAAAKFLHWQSVALHANPLTDVPPQPLAWPEGVTTPSAATEPSAAKARDTLYRTLFPDRPPLAGRVRLRPAERWSTSLVQVSLPSRNEILDDDGLVRPVMWSAPIEPLLQHVTHSIDRRCRSVDDPLPVPL